MATNPNVQRLRSDTPAFPDLLVPSFEIPMLPADVAARFPSLELWVEQFNSAHRIWENQLQHAVDRALQAQKVVP